MKKAPFTVFVEYDRGSDLFAAKVMLPYDRDSWDESTILDSVTDPGEDRLMICIAAVIPGHVESLWGGAINV